MTARNRNSNIEKAQDVTSGTPIRFETASSKRKNKHPARAAVLAAPEEFAGGFIDFLRENAIVGLAIGFVIGLQAQLLVKQLIASFIDPAFQLLFGQALSLRTFSLHFHGRISNFSWGAFVYSVLSFLFILAVIYAIYKLFKLDRIDKPKKDKPIVHKIVP
jgi:large-conductance mechanosensitive channel